MPASSIRDLVLHEDDIAVATHGRGFWILDDIEPLRQAPQLLYKPQRAWRFRWNKNTDTPLPADEPAGEKPPDGAIIDYSLASDVNDVTLEILDAAGHLVRRYSSNDPVRVPADTNNVPWYWIRPQPALPKTAGMHRWTWDLHYTPLADAKPTYPIAAIPHDTAPDPTSPYAMPGTYTIRLTAGGQTMTQPLVLQMDPRVTTSTADLQKQFDLSMKVYTALQKGPNEKLRTLLDLLQAGDFAPSKQLEDEVLATLGTMTATP